MLNFTHLGDETHLPFHVFLPYLPKKMYVPIFFNSADSNVIIDFLKSLNIPLTHFHARVIT